MGYKYNLGLVSVSFRQTSCAEILSAVRAANAVPVAEMTVAEHPFYSLQNCVLTPHIAGSEGDEVARMGEYMLDEYRAFASGEPCKYEVTEKMLETMA